MFPAAGEISPLAPTRPRHGPRLHEWLYDK